MFKVIQPVLFESVGKRCLSALSFKFMPSQLNPIQPYRKESPYSNIVLPLAAQQRCQHTVANMSSMEKMKWDLGFYGKLRQPKRQLFLAGFRLYICCTDFIDFSEFVKELNIPDSFTSWYLVLQVHLWLVQVRLARMGKEGLLLNQHMYKNMWMDVERRLNTFRELLGSEKRDAMTKYHSMMCTSILYYDEGLLGTDAQLANSLWVQLFSMDENVDARRIELMVEYVRKQAHFLDSQTDDMIMNPGYVSFLPLIGTEVDPNRQLKDMDALKTLSE